MTTKKQRFNKVEDVIEKTSQDGNDPFDYLEKTNVRQVMTPKKETKQIIDPKTDEVITPPSKNFDEAMLAFQKLSIAAVKDSKNPYFKNSYASLEEVMDAARQANQFGLYFAQPLQMIALLDQVIQVVQTEITHAPTGEKRTSQCPVRVADTKNPQAMGSGITYAKRYSLQAAFGLATDDDANEATKKPKGKVQHINPDDEGTW